MEFEKFYLLASGNVCVLTPDWKSDDKADNIWGFFVSENEEGACPVMDENEWYYASYTYDEETMDPISIIGPFGTTWMFYDSEVYAELYPVEYSEFLEVSLSEVAGIDQVEGGDYDQEEGEGPEWSGYLVD